MFTESFINELLVMQPYLLGFAYKLTLNIDDAKDLTQETSLKILDNQLRYINKENFKGWAMAIMKNQFINSYRRASRTRIIKDNTDSSHYLNTNDENADRITPESILSQKDIYMIINEFPDKLKYPFKYYLKGYSYQEIASKIGLSLGTVKSRIFLARKRLQMALADYAR